MYDNKNENSIMRIFYHSEALMENHRNFNENLVNFHDTYVEHIMHVSQVNLE